MSQTWWSVLLAATVLATSQAHAQGGKRTGSESRAMRVELPTDDQRSPAAKFEIEISPSTASAGQVVTLTVKTQVAVGWHIYPLQLEQGATGIATAIELNGSSLVPVDDQFSVSQEPKHVRIGTEVQTFHSGSFSWSRRYRVPSQGLQQLQGEIRFQACNETKCLPPNTLSFVLGSSRTTKTAIAVATAKHKLIGEPIEIALKACDAKRPQIQISLVSALLFGKTDEPLVLSGTLNLGSREFRIYLPQTRRYSLKNTSSGDTRVSNTATYVSIDYNNNGRLEDEEAVATNRPIRFDDSMFQVTSIDRANLRMTIQQVDAPLSGSVVGRNIVPFEFKTVDGKTVSNTSILGKVTLLDIWGVT